MEKAMDDQMVYRYVATIHLRYMKLSLLYCPDMFMINRYNDLYFFFLGIPYPYWPNYYIPTHLPEEINILIYSGKWQKFSRLASM